MRTIMMQCRQLQLNTLCERIERTTLILKHLEKHLQEQIS